MYIKRFMHFQIYVYTFATDKAPSATVFLFSVKTILWNKMIFEIIFFAFNKVSTVYQFKCYNKTIIKLLSWVIHHNRVETSFIIFKYLLILSM